MHSIPLSLAIGTVLVMDGMFAGFGYWIGHSRLATKFKQDLIDAMDHIRGAEELKRTALADLTDVMNELQRERRKSQGYFETIESVLKQRGNWESLYGKQAIEHGNAQALMMDTIAYLAARLREAKIEVVIPPLLKEVQELYQEAHVFPVLAAQGAPTQAPTTKALSPITSANQDETAQGVGVDGAALVTKSTGFCEGRGE